MVTIGLIGGIASGKSTVARMLAERGAAVLDADRAAHQVLNSAQVRDQLVDRWGPKILDSIGQIDRSAIAGLVFGDSPDNAAQRGFLESIVHPLARQQMEQQREKQSQAGQQVFVIDAPLLLEAGWDSVCDLIVMVDAPVERRRENAAKRDWSEQELNRREQNQLALSLKRARSDFIIENNGTLAETRQQVEQFWTTTVQSLLEQ